MKIFSDLGFEPGFFAAQIVNFLILAFLFQKFLYKPLLRVLKERERKIGQGLKDAEASKLALEDADAKKDEIITQAYLAAEKIIDETKKSAEELKEELLASSKKDAERIIKEAREEAQTAYEEANKKAEMNAITLSKTLLDKIISEIFTKEEKEKIMQRNIKRLQNYE